MLLEVRKLQRMKICTKITQIRHSELQCRCAFLRKCRAERNTYKNPGRWYTWRNKLFPKHSSNISRSVSVRESPNKNAGVPKSSQYVFLLEAYSERSSATTFRCNGYLPPSFFFLISGTRIYGRIPGLLGETRSVKKWWKLFKCLKVANLFKGAVIAVRAALKHGNQ